MSTQNGAYPLPAERDPRVRRMELLISRLLRTGVVISVALIVIGMVVTFAQHRDYLDSSVVLDSAVGPGATFPHTLSVLWNGMRQFRGEAIVTIGLIVLMATPVLRVAVSVLAFFLQRDRTYTFITAGVLCLLLLSLVLGAIE